jgi:hypothetical protein
MRGPYRRKEYESPRPPRETRDLDLADRFALGLAIGDAILDAIYGDEPVRSPRVPPLNSVLKQKKA